MDTADRVVWLRLEDGSSSVVVGVAGLSASDAEDARTAVRLLRDKARFWTGREFHQVRPTGEPEDARRRWRTVPWPGSDGNLRLMVPEAAERWFRLAVTGDESAPDAELWRRLYVRVRTLGVPLRPLLEAMPPAELQALLNRLLKDRMVEETMLAGFLEGHPELRTLVLANLSRNVREEVSRLSGFDRLWVERTDLLVREILARVWRESPPSSTLWTELLAVMEAAQEGLCGDRLEDGRFAESLLDADGAVLAGLVVETPSIVLARAVAGLGTEVRGRLLRAMTTDRKRDIFLEDLEASESRLTVGEVRRARREVFEDLVRLQVRRELSGLSPEKVARAFSARVVLLPREVLALLAYETGVVRLSKAFLGLPSEVRRNVVARAGPVLGGLWRDLFAGQVRYKAVVSRSEAETVRSEALMVLWVWERDGVVERTAGT